MSHAREHRDLSVSHATEPSWMFQSSSKSGVSAAGANQERFPIRLMQSEVHLLRWGPPGSCHDWRHFVLSGASIRGERHESAMSIVMNGRSIRARRPPQAVSRGKPIVCDLGGQRAA